MQTEDYKKVEEAIHYLRAHATCQPNLEEVSEQVGLSLFHFQRLFQRWAGVSPKRFLQFVTSQHARKLLKSSNSLLETSWDVGLSGSGRLHDLFVAVDAVTPGEFKAGGAGLTIKWGIHPSPFGACLVGVTTRGICALHFIDDEPATALARLQNDWPSAELVQDELLTATTVNEIFALLGGRAQKPLPLLLKGTNLQLQVWQALLKIPSGQVCSYGEIARAIGKPKAARAVGSAIGNNPIGWLIPCHRVLRGDGSVGGYRWGEERKLAILGQEWGEVEAKEAG